MKWVDERIDEGVLQCFGHVERMENGWIAKRVYTEESNATDYVIYGFRSKYNGFDSFARKKR